MNIYAVNIMEPGSENLKEGLLNRVSPEKKEKLLKMRFEEDQLRGAVGEILIRTLVAERLNIGQSDIQISHNDYGKPYIQNGEGVFINISHSGEWVLAAIGEHEMGIDVEKKGVGDLELAQSFFSLHEHRFLQAQPTTFLLDSFVRIWTLKESYIKALGRGLSMPLDSFSVIDEQMKWKSGIDSWRLMSFDLDDRHKGALCWKGSNGLPQITHISIAEI